MKLGSILKPIMQTFAQSKASFFRDRFILDMAMKGLYRLPLSIRDNIQVDDHERFQTYTISAPNCDDDRAIVFIHGGAMCFSMIQFYFPIAHKLSTLTKARVILPDYRLAPENPFPAGLEDCDETLAWTTNRWTGLKNVVVVGDSAGGNLALNSAISNPAIRGLVLMCPWLDLTHTSEFWDKNVLDEIVFPTTARRAAWLYTQGGTDWSFGLRDPEATRKFEERLRDPRISPIFADMSRAQDMPILIQASLDERLLGDSLSLWEKLGGQGVHETVHSRDETILDPSMRKHGKHQLSLYKGVPHVWQVTRMWTKSGQHAVTEVAEFINSLY